MGAVKDQIDYAMRDHNTDGVAASGIHDVVKSDVRAIGPLIETALANIGLGSMLSVAYATKAELDADLAHDADSVGLVYSDGTDANNDLYVKTGASGAGAWTNSGALHDIIGGLAQPYVDAAEAAGAAASVATDTLLTSLSEEYQASFGKAGALSGTANLNQDIRYCLTPIEQAGTINEVQVLERVTAGTVEIGVYRNVAGTMTFQEKASFTVSGSGAQTTRPLSAPLDVQVGDIWALHPLAANLVAYVNEVGGGYFGAGWHAQGVAELPATVVLGTNAQQVEPQVRLLIDYSVQTVTADSVAGVLPLAMSDSKRAIVEARQADGFMPRLPPKAGDPPLATLTLNEVDPVGLTATTWNTVGKWRFRGGAPSQFGGNPYMQFVTKHPKGNGTADVGCGMVLVETTITGGRYLSLRHRGSAISTRVLVNRQYVSTLFLTNSTNGQEWWLHVDLGAGAELVEEGHDIAFEMTNGAQFGGIYHDGELTPPARVSPKVGLLGTSVTENPTSWAYWWMMMTGCDVWNSGVGSSGVKNPGTPGSGKVILGDRSDDFVLPDFDLIIDENGINDSGNTYGWYTDDDYATVYREFYDEYRRCMDLRFDAWPETIWGGWTYWPGPNPPLIAYAVRDAKMKAISEYPVGQTFFVDMLDRPLVPGDATVAGYGEVLIGNSSDEADATDPDNTHLSEAGRPVSGNILCAELWRAFAAEII